MLIAIESNINREFIGGNRKRRFCNLIAYGIATAIDTLLNSGESRAPMSLLLMQIPIHYGGEQVQAVS